jgi:transmembrane sensor
MDDRQRLIAALRRGNEALEAERMPAAAVRRVARTLRREVAETRRPKYAQWLPMATFVAGAAAVLLVVLNPTRRSSPAPARGDSARTYAVAGSHCQRLDEGPARLHVAGACDVRSTSPAMTVSTGLGASLVVAGNRVELHRGQASFDVDHVAGAPVRIAVPGGEIVVVGTRFDVTIDADARSGRIALHEGALRFEHGDGTVSPIASGEVFSFDESGGHTSAPAVAAVTSPPDAAAVVEPAPPVESVASRDEPPTTPPAEAKRAPARPGPSPPATRTPDESAPAASDLEAILAEVAELRRTRRYGSAATRLRAALKQRWDAHTAEVLSYELGAILSRHLRDADEACPHWRAHNQRFGAGHYGKQIDRARDNLGCPESDATEVGN